MGRGKQQRLTSATVVVALDAPQLLTDEQRQLGSLPTRKESSVQRFLDSNSLSVLGPTLQQEGINNLEDLKALTENAEQLARLVPGLGHCLKLKRLLGANRAPAAPVAPAASMAFTARLPQATQLAIWDYDSIPLPSTIGGARATLAAFVGTLRSFLRHNGASSVSIECFQSAQSGATLHSSDDFAALSVTVSSSCETPAAPQIMRRLEAFVESPPRTVVLISSNACFVPHVERLQHKCEVWLIHGCGKEATLASAISNPVKCWQLHDVIGAYTMDLTHTTALLRQPSDVAAPQPVQTQQLTQPQPVQVQQPLQPQAARACNVCGVVASTNAKTELDVCVFCKHRACFAPNSVAVPPQTLNEPSEPPAVTPRECVVCGAVQKAGHEMSSRHVSAALRCGAPLCEQLQRREVTIDGRKLLVAIQANKKKQSASEMQVTVYCSVCGVRSVARMSRLDEKIFECHLACFAPACSIVLPQRTEEESQRLPAVETREQHRACFISTVGAVTVTSQDLAEQKASSPLSLKAKQHKSGPYGNGAFVDDQPDVHIVQSFDDMSLHDSLLRGIYAYGFEKPSAIQQRAIVPFIQGGDLIAQAQSGTGKTGAFSIGLLQRLDFKHRTLQAIVLSPTRELAMQTRQVISAIGEYFSGSTPFCHTFVGGTCEQEELQASVVIVAAGTPGRVSDVIKRGALHTEALRVLVLDEADEMLSQHFCQKIYEILRYLPENIQVALFGSTMPDETLELTKKFMRTPTRILVKKESLLPARVKQFYVAVEDDHKLDTLMDLYESVSIAQTIVFVNTPDKIDSISERLNKNNHTVSSIHILMQKGDREKAVKTFRSGLSRVLVATDYVARGIDVQHVNIVINFDLPLNKENYLHRIGRGGRYGRKGVAINFVSQKEVETLREIEAHYHTQIEELPMDFAAYLGE